MQLNDRVIVIQINVTASRRDLPRIQTPIKFKKNSSNLLEIKSDKK